MERQVKAAAEAREPQREGTDPERGESGAGSGAKAIKPLEWLLWPFRPLFNSGTRAGELMTTEVFCCGPEDDLQVAARILWEHDCGVVPVVDGVGTLTGVLTDRDICMAAFTRDGRLAEIRAGDVAAQPVHTCRPGADAKAVLRIMRDHQVRRVPIVDRRGQLQGIVSLADLVGTRVSPADIARTLTAICRPRPRPKEPARAAAS